MSPTSDALVHLPYTDDLTQAGITYACQSLPYILLGSKRIPIQRVRNTVAGIAGELALRRWLERQKIPYNLAPRSPITKPHRFHLILGGRRLTVISRIISRRRLVANLLNDSSLLLQAQALVPEAQVTSDALRHGDVFTFALMLGRFASLPTNVHEGLDGARPTYMIAIPPKRNWRQPSPWRRLGDLTIENPGSSHLSLLLSGQLDDRTLVQNQLEVPPNATSWASERGFHTLIFLHTPELPDAALKVRLASKGVSWTVFRSTWKNLWFYGEGIFLAGWMTKGNYAQAAKRIVAGSRTFLRSTVPFDHLAVPIEHLHPMTDLNRLLKV